MNFSEFEAILSSQRLNRYVSACNGNTRKAIVLYRYNLQVSQEMFTLVSCFEVALRNAIDHQLTETFGSDWLRNSIMQGGFFTDPVLRKTKEIIENSYKKLYHTHSYSHYKLLADMKFGIWKYMFSPIQYRVTGQNLLRIFPNKPRSSAEQQYNQTFFFNNLDRVNSLRNRIAHHEPVCFPTGKSVIDTSYLQDIHQKIHTLFFWMGIDSYSLLYGLDHVEKLCEKIKALKV